jgi:ATP-binding protein involved in chromosome partitioning
VAAEMQVSQVLSALTVVMDPDLGANIVSLNFIKNLTVAGGDVDFVLELTTPACPVKDQLKQQCVDAVKTLPFVKSVNVHISSKPMASPDTVSRDNRSHCHSSF